MSEFTKLTFCELPTTPTGFNIEKFKAGDEEQIKLYKASKKPNRDKILTYEQVMCEEKKYNYARVVPNGCCFIDFDNAHEFMRMKEIVIKAKLKCLILETAHGGHFLFRTPDFYKKEMTKATNWFGYSFDTKAHTDTADAVQIMRLCGMNRKEICSWDLTEVTLKSIDIEKLDILPYWLWGKLKDTDLHKKGKPRESEYTLADTPFTQLMKMTEGSRHDHIFSKCRMFALTNGFAIEEFRRIIQVIHDIFLTKIGSAMSDSDLFGDLEKCWDEYKETMTSSDWDYDEKDRKWLKVKSKKDEKIDERRASEWLYKQFDFYVRKANATGIYTELLYREKDGDYEYNKDLSKIRERLRNFSDQNFKEYFFKEMEVQLMQLCSENKKLIKRNHQYVLAKNKVLSLKIDFPLLPPPSSIIIFSKSFCGIIQAPATTHNQRSTVGFGTPAEFLDNSLINLVISPPKSSSCFSTHSSLCQVHLNTTSVGGLVPIQEKS